MTAKNSREQLLENLSVLANLLQTGSFALNVMQSSNDEIMKELQHQNKEYLEKIILQNNEIIELLKKERI